MLRWYRGVLARRPILTQCVTTGILTATGDVIAQQAVEKKRMDHDPMRTMRMASYGALIFGPAAANWYRFLSRYVVLKNKNAETAARVLVDQAVFSPAALGVFLYTMGTMDGLEDPVAHVKGHYWEVLKTNWMVWPAVQVANFRFVPLDHRLSFANVVAIGWNCYLSHVNSHKGTATVGEEGEVLEPPAKQQVGHLD